MSKSLILYDAPVYLKSGETVPASPNGWRARYALNIKGIDYRTEWVDLSDVSERIKKLGVPPTMELNGEQIYTIPTLGISDTEAVTDSQVIVQYLEKTYPSAPSLFPPGTRALQTAFINTHYASLSQRVRALLMGEIFKLGTERTRAYILRTRGHLFGGVSPEEVQLKGEARAEAIAGFIKELGEIDAAIGEGALFLAGDANAPSNADVHLAAVLSTVRLANGVDGDLWKAIMGAHGGRWERYMKAFEKFEKIV